jgi:ATP-dependent RNA helicase DeaD
MKLDALEVLVLDEADEMLDMGFAEDLEAILETTPESRQTALFAATMAPRIASIAERHLRKPVRIHIKAEQRPPGKLPRVRQLAYVVARASKGAALARILEFDAPPSAIVFCRTRIEVEALTDTLQSHGYGAQALHGGMEQKQRDRVMALFRSEKADVLVATDVAARGLDIEHVSHVINYDIPISPDVYVHRIGRTGRIGREGVAITLVDPREQRLLRNIESLTKQTIEVATLPTVAALKAKRFDAMRAALQQRVAAGDLEELRALVQSLAQDFDPLDVAAAAIALMQSETDARSAAVPAVEILAPPARRQERKSAVEPRRARPNDLPRTPGGVVQLALNVGKKNGVRPGDIVGAITGEAGITSRELGAIRISPSESVVEVPATLAPRIVKSLRGKWIRSQKLAAWVQER